MERIDGRSLDHRTLEHLRRLAVRRVRDGEKPSAVVKSLGFCRTSLYKWLRAYRKGGEAALASHKSDGPTPKLREPQRQKVRRWIVGKDPRQWGFDFGLWTRKIVQQMIMDKFGVSLTLPSVGHLLTSLEITPQKPLRRAYERDEAAVTKWKEDTYPKLRDRARKNKAEIFFLDEAGVRSDSALGRSYGLKGRTPVVKTSGKRQSINAISAVNPKGAFWYNVYPGKLNAASFIQFLRDFMKRRRKPVYMVLDSLPAHKTKSVEAYVQSTEGKLELHYLPTYAPDTNPDEFVWHHLKQNGTSKKPLRTNESLKKRVTADLSAIQNDPALVRSFFMAESVAYTIY
ncbi:MAG: IS630 family transposase [Nitrospira sp.]|nr:MAG: IS630 family transposase [Nitrospira sp.]